MNSYLFAIEVDIHYLNLIKLYNKLNSKLNGRKTLYKMWSRIYDVGTL